MKIKEQDPLKIISKSNFFNKEEDLFDEKKNLKIKKIIKNALNIESAKKSLYENDKLKRDELIERTREKSIINFLNDLQNKIIEKIKNTFL